MSADQDPEYFDLDRDILAPSRTPPFQRHDPDLRPDKTPSPPLVSCYPTSESPPEEDDADRPPPPPPSLRKRARARTSRTLADGVLIRTTDPNRQDVADHAQRWPLSSASQSEAEEEYDSRRRGRPPVTTRAPRYTDEPSNRAIPPTVRASPPWPSSADVHGDLSMVDTPDFDSPARHSRKPLPRRAPTDPSRATMLTYSTPMRDPVPDRGPPSRWLPDREAIVPRHQEWALDLDGPDKSREFAVAATLSSLGRFPFSPHHVEPDVILPALQHPSPPAFAAGSPPRRQTLPSLRTTIGQLCDVDVHSGHSLSPIAGLPSSRPSLSLSLPHDRPAVLLPPAQTAMSPPAPPSQINWRAAPQDGLVFSSSDSTSVISASGSTPSSSAFAPSPTASKTPPLSAVQEEEDRRRAAPGVHGGAMPSVESGADEVNADVPVPMSTRTANGLYHCLFDGCGAPAFSTQYLLNSHMNVHSNARTHFCPVKGCPRGHGGAGFKRRNEMLRHGLVHTSPGFVCPFCSDQLRRYPRSDNLLRHVKMRHPDHDRKDPQLCEVLDQRMNSMGRGGRRRTNS